MSEFVTASEASDILGCSEALIRKRIRKNELPATKDRGQWRILRADLDQQPRPHETTAPQDRTAEPVRTAELHVAVAPQNRTAEPHAWRDDLLAQVARLEANEDAMRADFDARLADQCQESGLLVEAAKARVIDLERELTVRDSRIVDLQVQQDAEVTELRGQVAVLEAKVREVLEDGKSDAVRLADRIADLVVAQQDMQARVVELQPVAERVPMLQAAVEEKDAALAEKDASLSESERTLQDREQELGNMRQDIDAIASRPVAGPVFLLLTKGKLRR